MVDEDEDPSAATPTRGGSGIAGGKGAVQPNVSGEGSGIAGGKGAPARGASIAVDPVETGPLSLVDQAAKSFDEFKEFDATQHLYVHWLTDTGAMSEYPLQWVAGISEPRLFFRWGVGVVYNAPTDFSDQPPLIGDPVAPTVPSANRSGRAAMFNQPAPNSALASPYAGVDLTTPTGNLLYHTGDFGERLMKRLNSRRLHRDFFYGKILAISKFKSPEDARPTTTTTTITTPATQRSQRAVVEGDIEEGTSRTVTTNNARSTPNTSGVVATTGTLVPGVIFLGTESDTDAEKILLERGETSGVDAVLIFYVTVKEKSRSDSAYSTTKLGVHNLKTGEKKETGSLSSETVAKVRQREKDSDNDPVEVALDKIFGDFADSSLRVSAMPEIKPEIAQKRTDTLVAESHTNPLPAVAEIMSYHKAGLLDDASTIAAVGKLIGGDDVAQKLLSGTSEEKLAAVKKWLPDDAENSGQSSGEKFR